MLRSLVLMRVKSWDYRELRERIADGCTLRQFTGFHCRPVPRHQAFHRAFVRLTPTTLRAVNDLVVAAAMDLELEDGAKLRVDTTVVQTDIHHPTDSTLLWDAVRVLTRLLARCHRLEIGLVVDGQDLGGPGHACSRCCGGGSCWRCCFNSSKSTGLVTNSAAPYSLALRRRSSSP